MEMTDEVKKALAGLNPLTEDFSIDFVPVIYENQSVPEEYRPDFKLRGYTQSEQRRVLKILRDMNSATDEEIDEMARRTVIGWKKLFNVGNGELIEFEADQDGSANKKLFVQFVPVHIRTKILIHASKASGLFDLDRLGLDSLPQSTLDTSPQSAATAN